MDWKREAIDKLRIYDARKNALASIPQEIRRLEDEFSGIRSAAADGTPVHGSGREGGIEDLRKPASGVCVAWSGAADGVGLVYYHRHRLHPGKCHFPGRKGPLLAGETDEGRPESRGCCGRKSSAGRNRIGKENPPLLKKFRAAGDFDVIGRVQIVCKFAFRRGVKAAKCEI